MDGANTDSDHSMTWEDFFGSTTDLAPTLLDIYDSLLEPTKAMKPEVSKFNLTARDNRNNPPLEEQCVTEPKEGAKKEEYNLKVNKSSLHTITSRITAEKGANNDVNSNISNSSTFKRTYQKPNKDNDDNTLSPNVRRLISGMDTNSIASKKINGTGTLGRTSLRGHRSNIPLIGATSKISQSGVNILPSVEIYDRPTVSPKKANKNIEPLEESPSKSVPIKPDFKIGDKLTNEYDVPKNIRPVTLTPENKNAFESLSLPYIDSSIEVSTANDREFDVKLSPRDNKLQSTHEKHSKFNNGSPRFNSKESIKTVNAVENMKPEKEVPKLNPPILEVSRPLSMSSIASSSSSSSGAQNKGVNSAYLASIESLDDHSDADMSGNGSNHFLNKAGILNSSISEERNIDLSNETEDISELSQLERVCEEIVQTENVYVQDLQEVVEGYLNVWRRESTFSPEELSELFNNIEEIYAFNRSLCEELNNCRLDATCISKCFVNNTSGFTIYTSYCTGYPRTMERLAALASTPHTAREFRERQVALGHPLPLASYLLKPVQRILKYHLLLQNLVKQCSSQETEYALLKMTGIAHHIDDMKRKHEHAVRVQEIQSLLYGWNGPDLTTYGELCAEGTFRVFGAKAMRHVFLFDKLLLVTKNREDNVLAYKSHIMCNNMMLVECISGAPLSFHVIPWDSPRSQLTLQARSHRHKREWTLLLKRVILENYNAVIPSHARQLVMELGQNKTDDDILAEKSHRIITQPSMRKQLSAPEYLEKRKLERERRKHFEPSRGRKQDTLSPTRVDNNQDCDCIQVSIEKGIDYTCENCYIDLCSDCETTVNKNKKIDKCVCNNKFDGDDCPECEKDLQFIDSNIEQDRKMSTCKCALESSQENVTNLTKTRGYHSSDSIAGFNSKSRDNLNESNSSLTDIKNIPKICIKCTNIKENVVANHMSAATIPRKSRINIIAKNEADKLRSKSRDDPQRSKSTKLRTWRRKSEPGLQNNTLPKKVPDHDNEKLEPKGNEKIEFECRNCGSNRISKKTRSNDVLTSDNEEKKKVPKIDGIKMYDTKRVPKKISKLKKTRAKTLRLGGDTTAKFYADFSNDMSGDNILHISESNDSLHDSSKNNQTLTVPQEVSKDADIDDEMYKKLIEKTDSFKKNELEKVKFLNKQKVIAESVETEVKTRHDNAESSEEAEKPLEEIISQLLMQNREFQKILKKQQLRNSAQRRHQRLLKSHSNPEPPKTETNQRKFVRQTSENLDISTKDAKPDTKQDIPNKSQDYSDDEHIYETLRVETKTDVAAKLNQRNSRPSSLKMTKKYSNRDSYKRTPESDYVYLSVNKMNNSHQNVESIYDVPIKSPESITNKSIRDDYYIIVEPRKKSIEQSKEDHYDSIIEVDRRKKNVEITSPSEYLPMDKNAQSPVTPEIWLSRQKEHFNVPRDRKSGSLPRSFQVVSTQEEESLQTFKSKRNSNGKIYLNKDGRVMSIDRPFTIALEKGEISYDDVEKYMNEQDMIKFNKISKTEDDQQDISKSTLALEEEIDQCYKNNFETLSPNKAESILNVSAQKLNTSTTSSCEALPSERNEEQIIHPEHKIYKPNNNILSLKNVLNRFKTKNINKSNSVDSNASESSPEIGKEIKIPFLEKRSGLNPRSYSKNLLHRFRSIIGDEQESGVTKNKDEIGNKRYKNDIKVVITTSDTGSATSISDCDPLSKSMYGTTTLTESQKENSKLEHVSQSCENINTPNRPTFDKSISLVTNASTSAGSSYSQRSSTSSYQSLNKLPIYMQGSKYLGARIAQSDYVDPSKLATDKSEQNEVNVLINKNSIRPDSLISSSSFVTSSSGGALETQKEELAKVKEKISISSQSTCDESYYEKSFERIESIKDDDVCRDSAVYSDQEDNEENRTQNNKTVTNKDEVTKETSISTQRTITRNSIELKTSTQTRVIATCSNINQIKRVNLNNNQRSHENKLKYAPPLPLKPKLTNIPSKIVSKSHSIKSNSIDFSNTKANAKPNFVKSVSVPPKDNENTFNIVRSNSIDKGKDSTDHKSQEPKVTPSNIHLKRLNFERASLDSALRKNTRAPSASNSSTEASTNSKSTRKSVQERRLEIESMNKAQNSRTNINKAKNLNASKFGSHMDTQVSRLSIDKTNNEDKNCSINENKVPDELKGSWVKTVVSKFE